MTISVVFIKMNPIIYLALLKTSLVYHLCLSK